MLKMYSIRQLIKYFAVSKIKRYVYRIFIYLPLPFSFYQTLEFLSSTALGKGWGCETIQDEVKLCLSLLGKTPRILIDIGAHRGEYTNCVITKFPKLKAYLFEPSKYNYELLKKKYEGQKNIIIENFALSNLAKKSHLYSNEPGSPIASLAKLNYDHFGINMEKGEQIFQKRFDEYWKDINIKIDYMKIDVEGNELDVLLGIGKFINNISLIQFEFGPANLQTKTCFLDFWKFFDDKDFSIYRITPRGAQFIKKYQQMDEYFRVTNFIAVNKKTFD
tara:strand:+ start:135 stop:962 length:828 start_codon:yes stop_codon:yes gene_type:complete